MMKLILSLILILFIQGCLTFNPHITKEEVELLASQIDLTDGIDTEEAGIIAQRYILSTPNSICINDLRLNNINTQKPDVLQSFRYETSYLVHFRLIGMQKIKRVLPISYLVDKETGEVRCMGHLKP